MKKVIENTSDKLNQKLDLLNIVYEKNKHKIFTQKQFMLEFLKWLIIINLIIFITPLLFSDGKLLLYFSGIFMRTSTAVSIILFVLSILPSLGIIIHFALRSKFAQNQNEAINCKVKFIEELMVNKQEKMKAIYKERPKNKVNEEEFILLIDEMLQVAYNYGYSKSKYQNYYEQGLLHNKLNHIYSDYEIKIFEDLIIKDIKKGS